MKTTRSIQLLLLSALTTQLFAVPLTVYNTGVDNSHTLLPAGSVDPHYSIVGAGGPNAVVMTGHPWLPNGPDSMWIWENANGQPVNVTRTFRTVIDLTGLDPTTASISGRWAVDNTGIDILVNNQSTGESFGGGPGVWDPFSIPNSLLVAGPNTIDFVVNDFGAISGFRAEFLVAEADPAVSAVPEGANSALLLIMAAFLVMGGLRLTRVAE